MPMEGQLHIRISQDLKKIAQYTAMMRGDSLGEIVRKAIERYVEESDKEIKELVQRISDKTK